MKLEVHKIFHQPIVWSYCADTMLTWTGVTFIGLLSAFRTSPSGGTVAYVPSVAIVTAGTVVVAVALPLTWNQVWRHGNTSMGIQVWEWESSQTMYRYGYLCTECRHLFAEWTYEVWEWNSPTSHRAPA